VSPDPHDPKPAVGRPFGGGVIVHSDGRKWGIVELPDGTREVRDVSAAVAEALAQQEAAPPARRRLLGLATHADLADEAGIEVFVQLILERTMDADLQDLHEHQPPA
jgi:hypothetical protein